MALSINSDAPDFEAETTHGPIRFHEWIGDSWTVLFSHPRNFTPVCTTELGYLAGIEPEFAKRGVKIIGLSVDPVENHAQWSEDIKETQGHEVTYPLIGDKDFKIAKAYGMLPADVEGDPTTRTPAQNATVRNVFVIGPDKKIKLILVYPMTTGRNFDEVLRVIDSLQLTAKHKVATPAQWQPGDDVIIAGSVSNDEATEQYPDGWETPKPYIRIVKQPGYEQPTSASAPADDDQPASDDAPGEPSAADSESVPEAGEPTLGVVEPLPIGEAPAEEPAAAAAEEPAAAAEEPAAAAAEPSSGNGHAGDADGYSGEGNGHAGHGQDGHDHASQSAPSGAASVIAVLDRTTRQVIAAAKPVAKRVAEYIENSRKK
jgi:alkyl hydroperoxide reductase subunit AhpC